MCACVSYLSFHPIALSLLSLDRAKGLPDLYEAAGTLKLSHQEIGNSSPALLVTSVKKRKCTHTHA